MSQQLISLGFPSALTKIVHSYQETDLDLEALGALPGELKKNIFSFSDNQDLANLSQSGRQGRQLTATQLNVRKITQVQWPKEGIAVAREILQGLQSDPLSCKKEMFGWPLNAKAVEFRASIPANQLPNFENHKPAVARMVAAALKQSCLIHVENFPSMHKDIDYFLTHRETREDRAVITGLFKVKDDAYESCDFKTQFDLDLGIELLNRKEERTVAIENKFLN